MKASSYFTVTYTEIRRQVCGVHFGCRLDICLIPSEVVLLLIYNYIVQQEYEYVWIKTKIKSKGPLSV